MAFPIELLTPRLQLRPPAVADAAQVFTRYSQDPVVVHYLNWKPHRTVDDTREYLQLRVTEMGQGQAASYLIFRRNGCTLLGAVGGRIQGSLVQFGYCLARDAWGHGYATEAAAAYVAVALSLPEIWRVQAFCDVENTASARVLEKVGLQREGTLRRYMVLPNLGEAPRDVFCYATVRA